MGKPRITQPATANRRISSRLALKTQPIISNEKMDTSNQQPTRNHQPEEQIKASDIDETENDVKDPKNEVEDPKNEVEQDPYFSPSPSPIPQRRPKRAASPPPPQKPADFSPESSASPIPVRRSKPRPVSPTPAATSTPIDQLHHSNPTASKRSKTHTLSPPPSKSPSLDHHQIKPENTRSSVPQIKPGNNQSGPVAQRPKPIRPQRPIKRALKQTDTTSIPTHDDDDFFNLSSRKQIQFVSKTLGLKGTPTGVAPNHPSDSKSPTNKNKVVNLSGDENSDEDGNGSNDSSSSSSSEDDDLNDHRKSHKKNHNRTSKVLPTWTRASKISHPDSSSDSDHEGSDNPDSKTKGECDNIPKPRKGKGRAMPVEPKSRSPTPPPAPDEGEVRRRIQTTIQTLTQQDIVSAASKYALESARKQEELRLLQALNSLDDPSITPTSGHPTIPVSKSDTLDLQHSGTDIIFTINMVLDPRLVAKTTKQAKDKYERPIRFEMKSGQRFDVVYQKFHELTGIPISQLVVSYDHIKLSPFVTPESVRIYANTALKVYDLNSWTYVCTERRQRARIASQGVEERDHEEVMREDLENLPLETNSTTEPSSAAEGGQMEDIEMTGPDQNSTNNGNGGGQTINLTVRTKDQTRVELTVKSSTTIRAILKNSLIELNLPPQTSQVSDSILNSKFKIHFDGLLLPFDSCVDDHDLDDDDVLDLSFL
ncbi:hypothetical protein MJO29_000955 [Puccinia striiformis f. sp. tritici]|nr:hypothetical protein MJO29_000955 [Puccinia striiformis f. sp. tritici]KAI9602217.1 hypothetical protein KEM48_000787 [Puccinia striiformis f. sp. tritici PST-130]